MERSRFRIKTKNQVLDFLCDPIVSLGIHAGYM